VNENEPVKGERDERRKVKVDLKIAIKSNDERASKEAEDVILPIVV
jgi:hypothetical protein